MRPQLDQKHKSISHIPRIRLKVMISALRNYRRILTSSKGPIIKSASSRINNLVHRPNFKTLHAQLLVTSIHSTHHLSYRKLDIILLSMAVGSMLDGSPVETDFISTIVQHKGDIDRIRPENMIDNDCWIGLVTCCIAIDWIVSVWIKFLRIGQPLLSLKTWRIGDWKVNNMCSFKMLKSIQQNVWTEILIPVHPRHHQYCPIIRLRLLLFLLVLIVIELACIWVAFIFDRSQVRNIMDDDVLLFLLPLAEITIVVFNAFVWFGLAVA